MNKIREQNLVLQRTDTTNLHTLTLPVTLKIQSLESSIVGVYPKHQLNSLINLTSAGETGTEHTTIRQV